MQKVLVYQELNLNVEEFLPEIDFTLVSSIPELYKYLRKLTKYTHLLVVSNSYSIWEQCKLEFPFLDLILLYQNIGLTSFELMKRGIDYPLKLLDYAAPVNVATKIKSYLAIFDFQENCNDLVSLNLCAKEKQLLEFMSHNKGKILTRDLILESVWGYSEFAQSRTIDVHFSKLKLKTKGKLNIKSVNTPNGKGYKLDLAR
jgi:hypothetical protein